MKQLNDAQMNNMRYAGDVLSGALLAVKNAIREGVTTAELNQTAEDYIVKRNCIPAFKGLYGYQFCCNTSVNDEIIHGLPSQRTLREGDIVTVDCGVKYNGMNTDACRTFGVGKISKDAEDLIDVTKKCFEMAFNAVKVGVDAGIVGRTIEGFLPGGYSVLHNFFGHGIGKVVHDDPLIANYIPKEPDVKQKLRVKFLMNTAICIEPMIILGNDNQYYIDKDKWTVITKNGAISAHYENTILFTKKGKEILTNKYC
ncbi:MAG: type I methionyl aminopeptidase [Christensenellaceae bacterium]|jgi:methionyl aminopeptidase|nr:type I methionyl aminopeptidase [Christensenellaceae bacterium]